MTLEQASTLKTLFAEAKHILLVPHEKPDGDALGSTLGLAAHLRDLGKSVTVFSHDPVPSSFSYLPGATEVVHALGPLTNFDVVVLLDIGDVKRSHVPWEQKTDSKPTVVVIDHHPTRQEFEGRTVVDVPVVHTNFSSTCEMVYQYLVETKATITKDIATCLLTGICTDTGNFQNLATTETCLVAASKLLIYGASLQQIVEATFRNKSVGALKLWGIALSRLKKDESTGQVTTLIRQADLDACGVDSEAGEGVSNFLNSLGEAKLILVLKEEADGTVRGSYRTTQPDIDVSAMAAAWGGGGHKKAAGFTVQNARLEETATGWTILKD